MLEVQTIDELERMVTIVELQANTVEAAFHPDDDLLAATETLKRRIGHSLDEHQPHARSAVVPHLLALKVRLEAALDRMRRVKQSRSS